MRIQILIAAIIFVSCGQSKSNSGGQTAADSEIGTKSDLLVADKLVILKDTTIKFLWCEQKDSINSISINEHYCKTISDPERAALGYVATFIGNECQWVGEAKEDRSNLKCKILTALDLGYQCSDRHLGFLRQWFRNDKNSLEELADCPTTPWTSTIQDTFEEIRLTIKGNKISVWFKANGVDTSEQRSWSWTETDLFEFDNDNLRFISTDKSPLNSKVEASL